MEVGVWDPRIEQDYVLESGVSEKRFSSLDHNTFAIEIVGYDWCELAGQSSLLKLANGTHTRVLTCQYVPWIKSQKVEEAFGLIAASKDEKRCFLIDSEYSDDVFSQLLNIRDRLGGCESGEWLFTGSDSSFVGFQKKVFTGFSSLLESIADYQWLLYMAEMRQTFLFFREFEDVDLLIDSLHNLRAR